MLETKFFEVRDYGTHIPVMCQRITAAGDNPQLMRAGFVEWHEYYFMINLNTMECQYDSHKWTRGRTMQFAHEIVSKNWDDLVNKQVIDVEFLKGETTTCKVSECTISPHHSL